MGKKDNVCDRCGVDQSFRIGARFEKARLFCHVFRNCMGEKVVMWLCWDCDWDVMNGGDPFEDMADVVMNHWENDYEYDPLNTPLPPGYE
jgi:hypothetical protein